MRHLIRFSILGVSLLLISALIAGCGGNDEDNNSLPAARTLLDEAIDNLEAASSFEMQIGVSGYPVTIDITGLQLPEGVGLAFKYAKGVFVSPDSLQASVEFGVGDLTAAAELIAIGHEQYLRMDLLTGTQWRNEELIVGFSPATLMDQNTGIPHALQNMSNLTMVGKEDLDGLDVYHLTGKVQASAVNALTFGLITSQAGELDIEVFILTEERQVEQILLREAPPTSEPEAEPTTWTITLAQYDEPVDVTAPALDEN